MTINVIKLFQDYHLDIATRGSQISAGWAGIDCPFCGKSQKGLGINLTTNACKCWRCGPHSLISIIKTLLFVDYQTAEEIASKYKDKRGRQVIDEEEYVIKRKEICTFPAGTTRLGKQHREYLEKRNYDPDEIMRLWTIRGTSNIGDYKFRIIIPVFFDNRMVSYQGRDITDKASLKYKACKAIDEVMPHQSIVYGYDKAKKDSALLVEGAMDVWRLGYGAIHCFGTSWTLAQANLLAERYKRLFILFDAEEEAQRHAHELGALLNGRRVEIELLNLDEGDPGEMPQDEANYLMKELGL